MYNIEYRKTNNQLSANDSRNIDGYALVFNSLSEDIGGFREIIETNSLDGVIEKSDVYAYLNHNKEKGVLARCKQGSGSLQLTIDEKGLNYQFISPETDLGNTVLEHIRRKEIDSSSFAFIVKEDEFKKNDDGTYFKNADGTYLRMIKSFDYLMDVSPVFNPAYTATSVCQRFLLIKEEEKIQLPVEPVEDEKRDIIINLNLNDNSTESNLDLSTNLTLNTDSDEDEETPDLTGTTEPEQCDLCDDLINDLVDDLLNDDEPINPVDEEECNCDEKRNNEEITKKIDSELSDNKNNNKEITKRKTMEKFNFSQMIYNHLEGRELSELELEVKNAGRNEAQRMGLAATEKGLQLPLEFRAITAGGVGSGSEVIGTDTWSLLTPLYNNLVLAQAGAQMINSSSNIAIPLYSGAVSFFEGENVDAQAGDGSFNKVTLSPKRLCTQISISKQLLAQDVNNTQSILQQDLITAIAEKLESVILGNAAGSATQPAGLFYGVTGNTYTGITYSDVTKLEGTLEKKNVNNYVAILNPSAKVELKSTAKNIGSFVFENGELDGIKTLTTNNVYGKGIVLMDARDLMLATFGPMDLTFDQVTKAGQAMVVITINMWVDAQFRRPSFVTALLA